MSTIKLNTTGGSGGSVALKGPASTTSNADVELTLPVDDGSADQYLKTNGSGVLSWATVAGGAALTGSTDNTICTVTGANAIQGEADFTFDGTKLELTKSSADPLVIIKNTSSSENEGACLKLWASARGAGVDDEDVLLITNNSDARNFGVSNAGTVNTTGNIVMAAGKGIDFTANTDDEGTATSAVTSELLNDYERGTWTPAIQSNGGASYTYHTQTGHYIKIGDAVYVTAYIRLSGSSDTGSNGVFIAGFPFTSDNALNSMTSGHFFYLDDSESPKVMRVNGSVAEVMKEHAYTAAQDDEMFGGGNARWVFAGWYTTA